MLDRQISHYNQYVTIASMQHQIMISTALIRELCNTFTEWHRDHVVSESSYNQNKEKGKDDNKGKHTFNMMNDDKNINVRDKNCKDLSTLYDKTKCFNCDKIEHYSHDCQSLWIEETKKHQADRMTKDDKDKVNVATSSNVTTNVVNMMSPSTFITSIEDDYSMSDQSFSNFLATYNVRNQNNHVKHCVDILDFDASLHITSYLFRLDDIWHITPIMITVVDKR